MTTTNVTTSPIAPDEKLLSILAKFDNLLDEYIRNYHRKDSGHSSEWLNTWFRQRSQWFLSNVGSASPLQKYTKDEIRELISSDSTPSISTSYRIHGIKPHYFRGFRNLDQSINLTGNLVVLDGRNSSGKTSLTEALEWLITGELLRRKLAELGNSRELENCICNQLRPEGEATWVEAHFVSKTGDPIELKRVLEQDYGGTKTSTPESSLFKNGKALNKIEEATVIKDMFAGEHPLLMQHSLRLFISSTPSDRRGYFERLLLLDEITHLIEKSVIGDAKLSEFSAPSGGIAYKRWENFKLAVQEKESRSSLRSAEREKDDKLETILKEALVSVACREFSNLCAGDLDTNQIRSILRDAQQVKRQQKFPILENLRPKEVIDDQLLATFSGKTLQEQVNHILSAHDTFQAAKTASITVSEAQLAVANVFQMLKEKNLISKSEVDQICPLCEYEAVSTLTVDRVNKISNWLPLQSALETAQANLKTAISNLKSQTAIIENKRKHLIPATLDEQDWERGLKDVDEKVKEKAVTLHQLISGAEFAFQQFVRACSHISSLPSEASFSAADTDVLTQATSEILKSLPAVLEKAKAYANAFEELDESVGNTVSEDPAYDLRQQWLDVEDDLDNLTAEIWWEQAKKMAQAELKSIRDVLMDTREVYLENRRVDFSEGISAIWEKLRNDRYSAFSKLRIPRPKGKGFPVEIEVKAVLDDSNQTKEVDALRVFSESQINVLGIAAFITRAKFMGHKMLVIDDPVQSMDEDHFLSFANNLLPYLLEEDYQIIILTHNDTFARDISHQFCDHDNYVTLKITHSRKKGCVIEEGNRRVAERLKLAEDLADDGDIERAWVLIRKAIERLYLVLYIKYGPQKFKPHSWKDQTAEYMWGTGVGEIIEQEVPDVGSRLKDILRMTAAGAHDKHARGKTDVFEATKDLSSLLLKLRVGG